MSAPDYYPRLLQLELPTEYDYSINNMGNGNNSNQNPSFTGGGGGGFFNNQGWDNNQGCGGGFFNYHVWDNNQGCGGGGFFNNQGSGTFCDSGTGRSTNSFDELGEILRPRKVFRDPLKIASDVVYSPVISHATETHDVVGLEGERKSTAVIRQDVENLVSLIDSFSYPQIRQHIASLNQTMSHVCKHIASLNQTMSHDIQNTEMSDSSHTCQLCAEKQMFKPAPVFCASCDSCIKPRTYFYWGLDDTDRKIYICNPCHNGTRKNKIPFQGSFMDKSQLQIQDGKKEEDTEEPWVQCDDCGQWQHQMCALYNSHADTDGKAKYSCPYCLLNKRIPGESLPVPFEAKDLPSTPLSDHIEPFEAKDLPSTPLSDHIEQRLFRQLNKDREDRAKKLGKNIDEVPKAEDIVVRVVLSSLKQLNVVILLQKIEGVDICLFAMYVQEYGSECALPNQLSVYISYLDSIKYFTPEIKALRAYIYQEILIWTGYIWVCPPGKCGDYILYCHPESQKIPSIKKLRHWYKAMLKKSPKEGIVTDITNMYRQFFCNSERTRIRSKTAENFVTNIEKPDGTKITKRSTRPIGYRDVSNETMKDVLVMQKLGEIFHAHKEDFIVAHLNDTCLTCRKVVSSIIKVQELLEQIHLMS